MKDDQEKEIMNENQEEISTNAEEIKEEKEINTNPEPNKEIQANEKEQNVQDNEQEVVEKTQEITSEGQNEETVTNKKNKKKGSYISGTIGAILGGFVASIPWILTYTFAEMIIAVLSTIIAGGAYLGYKIFKGKIGKAFPAIITIVSLLVVTVVTTVICPIILMAQSGFPITFDNLMGLYSDVQAEVRIAIFEDLAISLLFTIIGIAAIARSMSIQVKNNTKVEFSTKALHDETNEQETIENPKNAKKKRISLKAIMITILVVILIIGIGLATENILSKMEKQVTIPNTNISLRIDGSEQKVYETAEKIAEEFGAELTEYYDFIIEGTGEQQYYLYGQILSKSELQDYNAEEIMKINRDYDASYYSEEMTSEVIDKTLGDKNLKSYNFKYKDSEEKIYTGVRYLYEGTEQYLWIEVYKIDAENGELEKVDAIIEKLLN